MRLIDADKLKEKLSWLAFGAYAGVLEAIENAPTIDAEPVVHGRWIKKCDSTELKLICNFCGYDYIEADPDCTERHDYCPHCGAKMDEETD